MTSNQIQSDIQFEFPLIYQFPPFFTLQKNSSTLQVQLNEWMKLILNFCQFNKVFFLEIDKERNKNSIENQLFFNEKIKRNLNSDEIKKIFEFLIDQGKAIYDDLSTTTTTTTTKSSLNRGKSKQFLNSNKILVFWKTPIEWGELIYNWIIETGQNNSIMTFFELRNGELIKGKEFENLPEILLKLSLKTLEEKGKAKIFQSSQDEIDSIGVKFS